MLLLHDNTIKLQIWDTVSFHYNNRQDNNRLKPSLEDIIGMLLELLYAMIYPVDKVLIMYLDGSNKHRPMDPHV